MKVNHVNNMLNYTFTLYNSPLVPYIVNICVSQIYTKPIGLHKFGLLYEIQLVFCLQRSTEFCPINIHGLRMKLYPLRGTSNYKLDNECQYGDCGSLVCVLIPPQLVLFYFSTRINH